MCVNLVCYCTQHYSLDLLANDDAICDMGNGENHAAPAVLLLSISS